MTSGGFVNYGEEGPGEWITIYANNGHIFMIVAGLRFDTSGQGRAGTRWQAGARGANGFAVRHVPGLQSSDLRRRTSDLGHTERIPLVCREV